MTNLKDSLERNVGMMGVGNKDKTNRRSLMMKKFKTIKKVSLFKVQKTHFLKNI